MLYPIGDTQVEQGHKPILSHVFIGLNVLIFLYEMSLGQGLQQFVYDFGTIPNEIQQGEDLYTLITSIFLHGGWMHLIGNMVFLWVFGDNIEATIGSVRFFIFYMAGGLLASFAHIALNMGSSIPSIGASGAISAIMGAYLVMFPKSEIKVVFIILFRTFKMPALYFLGIWFVQQLMSGVGSMSVETSQSSGTAWWAHIGGFVYGLVAGWSFKDEVMKVPPSRVKYL